MISYKIISVYEPIYSFWMKQTVVCGMAILIMNNPRHDNPGRDQINNTTGSYYTSDMKLVISKSGFTING